MENAPVRVGQIRRWNGLHKNHSALDLVFRVVEVKDRNWAKGEYLKLGQHPEVAKETSARTTEAEVEFVRTKSELIEDENSYVTINVTRKDIDEGTCGNPFTCAVAHAAKRAVQKRFRRWKNLVVSIAAGGDVRRDEKDEYGHTVEQRVFRFDIPEEAADFISAFDQAGRCRSDLRPFAFRIQIPEQFVGRQRRA